MASIRDVAKRADVAVSTVSKVLNNYPNIAPETVNRVRQAAKELHYVPNAIASALSSKHSNRVGVLLSRTLEENVIDGVVMKYMAGMIGQAKEQQMNVVPILRSGLQEDTEVEMVRLLQAQSIGAVVVVGLNYDDEEIHGLLQHEEFKFVVVNAPYESERISSVGVDQKKAQKDVARKTITENQGPSERVLYISGSEKSPAAAERVEGMKELAAEMGFEMEIICGEYRESRARKITLERGNDFDIIVCASDMMAIGAMRALIEMDVFHPVCGFDGINLMGYAGKQMNTVKQDFRQIGALAVEECARLMTGAPGQRIVVPHELVRIQYMDVIH